MNLKLILALLFYTSTGTAINFLKLNIKAGTSPLQATIYPYLARTLNLLLARTHKTAQKVS